MHRPAKRPAQLDATVAQMASHLRSPRSCVVVLTNRTSIPWELTALTMRRGNIGCSPPARIAPWSFTVFSAQSLAAHIGAGCDGTARYRSRLGHTIIDVTFDVPYAGSAVANIDVRGPGMWSIDTSVRPTDGNSKVVFYLQMTHGPLTQTPEMERSR